MMEKKLSALKVLQECLDASWSNTEEFHAAMARHPKSRSLMDEYERWMVHSIDCAKALLPYESPRLVGIGEDHGAFQQRYRKRTKLRR